MKKRKYKKKIKEEAMPIEPYVVYKPVEVAKLLKVDRNAIYIAVKTNKLKKKNIGKGFRILGLHVLQFMGSNVYKEI